MDDNKQEPEPPLTLRLPPNIVAEITGLGEGLVTISTDDTGTITQVICHDIGEEPEDPPTVCGGCFAIGAEPHDAGCIDAAIEARCYGEGEFCVGCGARRDEGCLKNCPARADIDEEYGDE